MNNIVSKFGGSSLADADCFKNVKKIIEENNDRKFIVVSAPGKRDESDYKITDRLLACYNKMQNNEPINKEFADVYKRYVSICEGLKLDVSIEEKLNSIRTQIESGRELHWIASRGEYLCSIIMAAYLGWNMVDATECIVFEDTGCIDNEATYNAIKTKIKCSGHAVIPGFYGATRKGRIYTFPRNGSDITGALVARGVGADIYENWTDVDGFLMADPCIVNSPRKINQLSYLELKDLSYMGASVIHEDSIFPVSSAGIKTIIKNTNNPSALGTVISDAPDNGDKCPLTGVAGKNGFAIIHIEKSFMKDEINFIRKFLGIFERFEVPIDHLACGIDSVSVLVREGKIRPIEDELIEQIIETIAPDHYSIHSEMSLIAIVGRKMKRDNGNGKSKIFSALAREGINTWLIDQGASSVNIFVGVDSKDYDDAIRAIYKALI